MTARDKVVIGATVTAMVAAMTYGIIRAQSIRSITGVVLRDDPNPASQSAVPSVEIRASYGGKNFTRTDASGYFQLRLGLPLRKGEELTLHFEHPNYTSRDVTVTAGDRLLIIRLAPSAKDYYPAENAVAIGDVRLRYTVPRVETEDIGSLAKVFEVANRGDEPCLPNSPCSPDGKWKAAIGGISLDAGAGNEFRNARVYCVAGPCPFTRIDRDSFSRGGRQIAVQVRDWSDPASFVIEAEVMHTTSSDTILYLYPIIFDQTASFTLPPKAQGVSVEATINRQQIVYPLGPQPKLSWADCDVQTRKDQTKLYRCVLKPGYRFQ
jgi:hypothetical protein